MWDQLKHDGIRTPVKSKLQQELDADVGILREWWLWRHRHQGVKAPNAFSPNGDPTRDLIVSLPANYCAPHLEDAHLPFTACFRGSLPSASRVETNWDCVGGYPVALGHIRLLLDARITRPNEPGVVVWTVTPPLTCVAHFKKWGWMSLWVDPTFPTHLTALLGDPRQDFYNNNRLFRVPPEIWQLREPHPEWDDYIRFPGIQRRDMQEEVLAAMDYYLSTGKPHPTLSAFPEVAPSEHAPW